MLNARPQHPPCSHTAQHNIIDLWYSNSLVLFGEPKPYREILQHLQAIPGVVLSGLFLGLAQAAVVVRPGGSSELLQLK